MLAMERGEVEGHSTSLEVIRAVHPDWLPDKKVTPLVQYALKRHHELPDVPMSWELGRNDEERQILRVVANATEVGKMILSTPDTPMDRITALRRAFDATMKDPAFIAELKAQRVEQGPMTGRGIAEARRRGRHRVAGDHRQGQGDLSAELIGWAMLRSLGTALTASILLSSRIGDVRAIARGLLSRQDRQRDPRLSGRRRQRHLCAGVCTPHRQAHPGQSQRRLQGDAGRRQPRRRQSPVPCRAEGRHGDGT